MKLAACLSFVAALSTIPFDQSVAAGGQIITVTRKDKNVYKIDGTDTFAVTKHCHEYVYGETAYLKPFELMFLDSDSKCDLKGLYVRSQEEPGKYDVTLSNDPIGEWFEIHEIDGYVRAIACTEIAVMNRAVLTIRPGGHGSLYFPDSDRRCTVEGVYGRSNAPSAK